MINFVKDYLSQNDILHIPYPQDGNYYFLIENLIKYLKKKNNSDNIKGIIFDDLYTPEDLEIFGYIGNKIKYCNFSSLEFMKIRKYTNNLRNIKIYYELNKLFSANSLLGLTIINKDDIKNIFNLDEEEKKLKNKFSKKNEILYIDLEGYSPYTENFYFLCKNYLNNNNDIQTIVFDNFDIIDDSDDIKNKKKYKLNFPNIKNIYYENYSKKSKGEKVKEFINLFFDINNLFYLNEGFYDKDDLKYINYSKDMDFDIIKKLKSNNLFTIIIEYKKIIIKYNKELNKLNIINNSYSENLNKNFINDLTTFYYLLNNCYENINYKIERNIEKKIIFETITRNSKFITKYQLNLLSGYLNFLKYHLHKVPIEYLFNDDFNKNFLLVIKTRWRNFCLCKNNNWDFYYNFVYKDYINFKIKKEVEGDIISLKIKKICILKYNKNDGLLGITYLNNSFGLIFYDPDVEAELFILENK